MGETALVVLVPDAEQLVAADQLIEAVMTSFPDCPPYSGTISDPVPHLTVADGADATTATELERVLQPGLPVTARVERITLIGQDAADRWIVLRRVDQRLSKLGRSDRSNVPISDGSTTYRGWRYRAVVRLATADPITQVGRSCPLLDAADRLITWTGHSRSASFHQSTQHTTSCGTASRR